MSRIQKLRKAAGVSYEDRVAVFYEAAQGNLPFLFDETFSNS